MKRSFTSTGENHPISFLADTCWSLIFSLAFVLLGFSVQSQNCLEITAPSDNQIIPVQLGEPASFMIDLEGDFPMGCGNNNLDCMYPITLSIIMPGVGMPVVLTIEEPNPISLPYTFTTAFAITNANLGVVSIIASYSNEDCTPNDCCSNSQSSSIMVLFYKEVDCFSVTNAGPSGTGQACQGQPVNIEFTVTNFITDAVCPGIASCFNPLSVEVWQVGGGMVGSATFMNVTSTATLNLDFVPPGSGQYYLLLSDGNNSCPGSSCALTCNEVQSSNFNVTVVSAPSEPSVSISPAGLDDLIINCETPEITLTASAAGNPTITWVEVSGQDPVPASPNNVLTLNASSDLPGEFSTAVTQGGCTFFGQEVFEVQINTTMPTASITSDNGSEISCENGTIILTGDTSPGNSGTVEYAWFDPDGNGPLNNNINDRDIELTTANVIAGNYLLEIVHKLSRCEDSETFSITIDADTPLAQMEPSNDEFTCSVTEIELDFDGSVFQIMDDITLNEDPISIQQPITIDEPGFYKLLIQRGDCNSMDTITIGEDTKIPGVAINGANAVCQGQDATFEANTDAQTPSYAWTLPDNTTSSNATATLLNAETPGMVNLVVTDLDNDCVGEFTANFTIRDAPMIDGPGEQTVESGTTVDLDYTTDIGTHLIWEVDLTQTENIDLDNVQLQDSTEVFTITETLTALSDRVAGYITYLVFTFDGDCPSDEVLTTRVNVGRAAPILPELLVQGSGGQTTWNVTLPADRNPEEFSVTLYDRTGCVIFPQAELPTLESFVINDCPDGVYYYIIFDDKNLEEYARGAFTVLSSN